MIEADTLEYQTIFQALKDGQFCASCGPIIRELYIEDDCVVLECEPTSAIRYDTCGRTTKVIRNEDGSPVTKVGIPISREDIYFRFEVMDEREKEAYTNAYFMRDLQKLQEHLNNVKPIVDNAWRYPGITSDL